MYLIYLSDENIDYVYGINYTDSYNDNHDTVMMTAGRYGTIYETVRNSVFAYNDLIRTLCFCIQIIFIYRLSFKETI